MTRTGIVAGVAGVALGVAACGGGSSGGSSKPATTRTAVPSATKAPPASGGGGESVAVAAPASGALKFTTSSLKAKAGKVTFKFDNPSTVPHAFAIEGHGIDKSGAVVTHGNANLTVTLKPGTYTFYCPVDSHRQAGMKGTLTVSG